jgi:alcohol dehydrogenase
MAKKGSYIEYSSKAVFEPQQIFSGSGASQGLPSDLKSKGTRRVLIICSKAVLRYKSYEVLTSGLTSEGIRFFVYEKEDVLLRQSETEACAKMFKEYNCDTCITIGGVNAIDCGKLTIALNGSNNPKNAMELAGDGKVKKGKGKLCCIVTDAGASAATPFAEFQAEGTGKWMMVRSSLIVPPVVVIDTDFSARTDHNKALDSALTAFCEAIEAYISPVSSYNPLYRANAVNACVTIYSNISSIKQAAEDAYLRYKLTAGGLCAGLSLRMTGLGYSHLAVHAMLERYGDIHGAIYLKILRCLLEAESDLLYKDLADLARHLNICTKNADDRSAAQTFIDALDIMCRKFNENMNMPEMTREEALDIAEEVKRAASVYDLYRLDSKAFAEMLMAAKGI